MRKTLVLGIGNTIRGDDALGIFAVRLLKEKLDSGVFDIRETHEAGLSLLDMISGFEKAVIVDSINTGKKKPGSIYRFTKKDFLSAKEPYTSHQMGLGALLGIAGKYEIVVPEEIVVYAIEIKKADSFKEGLSTQAKNGLLRAVGKIEKELKGAKRYGSSSIGYVRLKVPPAGFKNCR